MPTLTSLGVPATTVLVGQPLTLTATVTVAPPNTGTPTGGTVTFDDGSTVLGTALLTAGTAQLTTSALALGSHVLTASYGGDGVNYLGGVGSTAGSSIIVRTAGNGLSGYSGDGAAATAAELAAPSSVVSDAAGNLYIADRNDCCVREINAATGIITTVAGNGNSGYSGDSGQATAAAIGYPYALATDAAGNLYLADENNDVIRKVNFASSVISTVAGTGAAGFAGDGGQATAALLDSPLGLAVDQNGDIFIADWLSGRVREVNASTGIISTVAGGGSFNNLGDGGPATAAHLSAPRGSPWTLPATCLLPMKTPVAFEW